MNLDVLIADQDVRLAKLYCRFLASHGISADAARCGLECLRLVCQQTPDVLVLDRELPWGDADGVLACLREDGRSLPVILTTWKAAPESDGQLVVAPVVLCLRKFFPLPDLLDGVHFALANHSMCLATKVGPSKCVCVETRGISNERTPSVRQCGTALEVLT